MSFTSTFRKEKAADGSDILVLVYTDGVVEHVERFQVNGPIDQQYLAKRVRDTITNLNLSKSSVAAIPEGIVVPASPDPSPIATQAELDLAQFLKDLQTWKAVKAGIDLGIIDGTNAAVVAFQNKVKSAFKVAYIPYLAP